MTKKLEKQKSPYHGYSLEDVFEMENNYFTMQFGNDFLIQDGVYLFTRKETEKIYNSTLANLLDVMANGEESDRKRAIDILNKFTISPMRLH